MRSRSSSRGPFPRLEGVGLANVFSLLDGRARAQEAKRYGDEFLALEKYVNLNYMVCVCAGVAASGWLRVRRARDARPADRVLVAQGFHKILKKHDKCLPHAPCRQFYVAHLHQQPWVQVCACAARRA